MRIDLVGEQIELRPDRSLHWLAKQTLVLADPHFGKADAFRAAGVPVPGGSAATLMRLSEALTETRAGRLIILGDFWHDRSGRTERVLEELRTWRGRHSELHIELLRGNHDRAGPPPENWADAWLPGPLWEFPFAFHHYPIGSDKGYVLAGHLHPGVVLRSHRQRLRLPAFWITLKTAVLPAFGSLTGLSTSRPDAARIFAVAGDEVLEVP